MSRLTFLAVAVLLTSGCVNGPCRQVRQPDLANQVGTPPAGAPGTDVGGPSVTQPKTSEPQVSTLFVYKPDGSLQCGSAKGQTPEEMEKRDLGGIKVLSREKRASAMMRIKVCGSATGDINVYEIPAGAVKTAEARGFSRL